ncbi:unnamed protein product [Amoebophrya sp. A25]|nr:unnamed protein product [Amoebophrya sp. A25]|eukprot:GSA25T00003251001.1
MSLSSASKRSDHLGRPLLGQQPSVPLLVQRKLANLGSAVREEIDVLGRLLYRSAGQHRGHPIHTRMKAVHGEMRNLLILEVGGASGSGTSGTGTSSSSSPSSFSSFSRRGIHDLIRAAVQSLGGQIGHGFFLPYCATCLAILGKFFQKLPSEEQMQSLYLEKRTMIRSSDRVLDTLLDDDTGIPLFSIDTVGDAAMASTGSPLFSIDTVGDAAMASRIGGKTSTRDHRHAQPQKEVVATSHSSDAARAQKKLEQDDSDDEGEPIPQPGSPATSAARPTLGGGQDDGGEGEGELPVPVANETTSHGKLQASATARASSSINIEKGPPVKKKVVKKRRTTSSVVSSSPEEGQSGKKKKRKVTSKNKASQKAALDQLRQSLKDDS